MTNDATLGICSEFIYDEGCKIEEAVIQFKIDDENAVEADTKKAEDPEFYTLFPLLISVLELGHQGISTAFAFSERNKIALGQPHARRDARQNQIKNSGLGVHDASGQTHHRTAVRVVAQKDRKSTRLNSSHSRASRMPSSA